MHMHGEDGDRDDVEVISVGQISEKSWEYRRMTILKEKMD